MIISPAVIIAIASPVVVGLRQGCGKLVAAKDITLGRVFEWKRRRNSSTQKLNWKTS